jgi:hypothetical protein
MIEFPKNIEKREKETPQVTYDESLLDPKCPYSLNLDEKLCADLLRECGVSEERIGTLKIRLTRKSLMGFAHFNPFTHSMMISGDEMWKWREECIQAIDSIIKNEKAHGNPFKKLLTTKRLVSYLQEAPPERGREFAQQLVEDAINRKMSGVVGHEGKHTADIKGATDILYMMRFLTIGTTAVGAGQMYLFLLEKLGIDLDKVASSPAGIAAYAASLISQLYILNKILYEIDPYEIRARSFQRVIHEDPRFRRVLTVEPRAAQE